MVRIPSQGIAMGKYEVTRGQYAAFVAATGYSSADGCRTWNGLELIEVGGNWRSPGFNQGDDEPVVCVSWQDANAYAEWLSKQTGQRFRLPSEQEWYSACQAEDRLEYCGSDDIDSVAWYIGNSGGHTHKAGQKQPNALGLYDMSGNVYEWTSSCWENDCSQRVDRGGSWVSEPEKVLTFSRFGGAPANRLNFLGFRLAQD